VVWDGRCRVATSHFGRQCQLYAGHDGTHAAYLVNMYISWLGTKVLRWSVENPPPWLLYLPWARGFHPSVPSASPLVSFDSV
jgi:hypothetical protein